MKKTRCRSRGFSLVEIMTTVAIIGILASMAMPAFNKYVRRTKTSEALMNLRKIFDGSVEYFSYDFTTRSGFQVKRRFPAPAAPTPGMRFCIDNATGGRFKSNPTVWDAPTWRALSFGISDPHYYSYQYDSEGLEKASKFTARALGDLNCNLVFSTFERVGSVNDNLNVVGGGGIFSYQELE